MTLLWSQPLIIFVAPVNSGSGELCMKHIHKNIKLSFWHGHPGIPLVLLHILELEYP